MKPLQFDDQRPEKTSWEPVAKSYGKKIKEDDSFQAGMVFPGAFKLLAPMPGKKYLDIACGEGTFAALVAKTGAEVTGFDISSSLIKAAEAKKIPGANFRVGNAKDFARYFDKNSFD